MLECMMTVDSKIEKIEEITRGCWISLINPNEDEIARVAEATGADQAYLRAALDDEETSRIDPDENQTLIIADIPIAEKTEIGQVIYSTLPLGVLMLKDYIVTICLKESGIIQEIAGGKYKHIQTTLKTRFIFQLFFVVATRYLQYLRQIDKISKYVERQLHKSMKNKELIQLLDLEKSLVFFSTSLSANEVTLKKIMRGNIIKLYEEDHDLLEDVLIEFSQAIEMTNIYSNILSGTMDAFASLISNNLNIVMKVLAGITILLAIPTIVFSFYGMNVANLPFDQFWWFPTSVSGVLVVITGLILVKKGMM